MIGKIIGGVSLIVLGFLFGFIYGTELGHLMLVTIKDFIMSKFSGG